MNTEQAPMLGDILRMLMLAQTRGDQNVGRYKVIEEFSQWLTAQDLEGYQEVAKQCKTAHVRVETEDGKKPKIYVETGEPTGVWALSNKFKFNVIEKVFSNEADALREAVKNRSYEVFFVKWGQTLWETKKDHGN